MKTQTLKGEFGYCRPGEKTSADFVNSKYAHMQPILSIYMYRFS